MTDFTDDDRAEGEGVEGTQEDPPTYRSGRVRIIGAEPAGDSVREVTGPVVEQHPDLPHWNDAPTGQVPSVLDRTTGEEPLMAPPTWREEENDWEAQEEMFEPSMLSDDLPAVGALINDNNEEVDMERQPWHFEADELLGNDETLIIEPERPPAPEPAPGPEVPGEEFLPSAAPTVAASRLTPPGPPPPRAARSPRTSRSGGMGSRTANAGTAGTGGRNMRLAVGSGLLLGVAALACFAAGPVPSMVIVTIVVLLATAEAYAAFRRAQYHPATLLGLVAVLSLMIETYNKGVVALPLVVVLLVAGTFLWFLLRVEPDAEPVAGLVSTVFVFAWVGGFGSFSALLLNPTLFPFRHGVAFMLAAVITTVAYDVAALLVGSAMGKHPLAPSISPNKTWEGFVGGALAAILVAVVVVHFIHPWTVSKALIYGVVVAVVAPLGDLSQSMMKRHLGLKDMGRLLPGHGGILDRVDGLLFVLPATYFVVKALHLG
ncbi:MAG TPA: phosphatidate cytidylyltransferase [Acidimicrobiales bacterium]|nr:phosphatidate cytidylyltransferase [Acidimicrobiales bacterium]